MIINFKTFVAMKDYKVLIESVLASDQKALTAIQMKINQWITTGILKKYDIHTAGDYIIFNILKNNEPKEDEFGECDATEADIY